MTPTRVLIVDDSATVRRILRNIVEEDPELQVAGVAANGRIALDMLRQNVPDVVTLDIEMPEMDGLATLVKLRESYPRLPVIMFSTLTERAAVATLEALARGATDYITKPALVGDVTQAIRSIREQLIPRIKTLCGGKASRFGEERAALRQPARRGVFKRWPNRGGGDWDVDRRSERPD